MAFNFLSTVMSMHIDTSVAPEDTRYFSENWNEEEHNSSPKDEEHAVKKKLKFHTSHGAQEGE